MTAPTPPRARPGTRRRELPLTEAELRQDVAAMTGLAAETITGDAHLVHLGLGSLEMMRLVTRWRRQGVPADFAALAAAPTLDAWHQHLSGAWASRDAEVA
ncbi:hypothetical protein GCM10010329_63820 [Streptomyces spiroverticillatus]|uniref:Carrier domain-containing protein n=1 Tax=Streptomyces finlayi TaxID=67296 RepID=A0A918X4F1_9ACTN|nr:phosphopantetheine-binding protein [Streptomyces finlayi]GHA31714.1 hypothetical protein GCM10010329_63820 [Streptomyces spiroverticillatus]GHD10937.1 hypothetical protein GCM10010334_66730 [Streptomyces finlayi]